MQSETSPLFLISGLAARLLSPSLPPSYPPTHTFLAFSIIITSTFSLLQFWGPTYWTFKLVFQPGFHNWPSPCCGRCDQSLSSQLLHHLGWRCWWTAHHDSHSTGDIRKCHVYPGNLSLATTSGLQNVVLIWRWSLHSGNYTTPIGTRPNNQMVFIKRWSLDT